MTDSLAGNSSVDYFDVLSDHMTFLKLANSEYCADFPCDVDVQFDLYVGDAITIKGSMSFGDAIADTMTVTGPLNMGTNSAPLVLTAGTPLITLYTTNAGTSGSVNAESLYVKTVLTGAGQVGGRAKFILNANAAQGSWINAIKGETTFGASGSVTGLGSVVCGDLTLSAGTSSGTYACFEGNIVAGSGASTGTLSSFIRLNADGADEDTVDSNAVLFDFGDALDAASGKFIDTDITTHTAYGGLKINIDGVGIRYIALVSN